MWLIPLFVLMLLVVGSLGYLWLAQRDAERRVWYGLQYGALYDAIEDIGISALVVDDCSLERVDALLAVEYPRYEVVLVVNRQSRPTLFERLIDRFYLIRVEYHPTGELPVVGVRGLYRSRKRRFRRLVLLDLGCRLPRGRRLDVAADVATYEYLLPVPRSVVFSQGAIERVACELDRLRSASFDRIGCFLAPRAQLYVRSSVVLAGGFRQLPRGSFGRRMTGPIFVRTTFGARWRQLLAWSLWGGLLLFALIGSARGWLSIAVGATVVWVGAVCVRVRQLARF